MRQREGGRLPVCFPAQQTDYRGLPPCRTFAGEGEPFYAEVLQYAANLRAAGIKAEADVYPTDVHAFDMLCPERDTAKRAGGKLAERIGRSLARDESSIQPPLQNKQEGGKPGIRPMAARKTAYSMRQARGRPVEIISVNRELP